MPYHAVLQGRPAVVVGIDDHPKVAKGGNHAVDFACAPGDPVFACADGKIPAVRPDELDGGTAAGTFFTIDVTRAQKGVGPAVRVVYAHVVRADRKRAVVKAGEQIGTCSSRTLHVGCNLEDQLQEIVAATI